ncbi:Oxysterol-binding protein OBPa, partial [Oleoguttula sp. CCFEE 5521]
PKLFAAAPAGDEEKLDWVIGAKVDPSLPAEQQVQQILAITPILPLQLTQKLQQGSRSEKAPTNNTASQHTRPQTGGANDLIDFGQNEAAASHADPQQTAKSQPQQIQQPMMPTQQSASQQAPTKQLADMSLSNTKSSSTQNQAGSMNRAGQIVRQDSLGNEEAFVDAES